MQPRWGFKRPTLELINIYGDMTNYGANTGTYLGLNRNWGFATWMSIKKCSASVCNAERVSDHLIHNREL